MKVKLIYPASLCDRPHVAEAMVEARLTPKQIVVPRQEEPQIRYTSPHSSKLWLGMIELRFWRHHGRRVGSALRSWRLAPGELERLNAEASKGGG
jgi:hypothetical protein